MEGGEVGKFCTNCGTPRDANDRFCAKCGHALNGATSEAPVAAAVAAPPVEEAAAAVAVAVPPPVAPPPPPTPVDEQPTTVAIPVPPAPGTPAAVEPDEPEEHETTVNVYQYATPPGTSGGYPVPPPGAGMPIPSSPSAEGQRFRREGRHVHVLGRRIQALPLLAGIAVMISSAFGWLVLSGAPTRNAFDYPVTFKFLFDANDPGDGLKLGVVLLLVGAAIVVLTLFSLLGPVRRWLGLAAVAIAIAYAGQLYHTLHDNANLPNFGFGDLFDYLGPGPYIALIAGVFATQK